MENVVSNEGIGEGSVQPASVSIVVPTYQEAPNLRALLSRIATTMSSCNSRYEVIIVDDNSRDGTDEVVETLCGENYPVRLITRTDERGLSSAVIRGFEESKGEVLICMDADLSHQPEAIPQLLECFGDPEVDFALGSRYVPGGSTDDKWGLARWLNSKLATLLARPFTHVKDPMSGFFAIRRSVFSEAAALNPVGYKIALELIVKCKCRKVQEIPIHFVTRQFGQSKLNFTERVNYVKHIKRLAYFKCREFVRPGQL